MAFGFEKHDVWWGLYWRWRRLYPDCHFLARGRLDVWVCFVPCLPLHLTWYRR